MQTARPPAAAAAERRDGWRPAYLRNLQRLALLSHVHTVHFKMKQDGVTDLSQRWATLDWVRLSHRAPWEEYHQLITIQKQTELPL